MKEEQTIDELGTVTIAEQHFLYLGLEINFDHITSTLFVDLQALASRGPHLHSVDLILNKFFHLNILLYNTIMKF